MLKFIVGFIVGAFCGILFTCLCVAADEKEDLNV